jgi:hypothetical protein
MTKNEAKAILNRVREGCGQGVEVETITAALYASGDLRMDASVRSERLDSEVQREGQAVWGLPSEDVVGADLRGFRAYSWARKFGGSQKAHE